MLLNTDYRILGKTAHGMKGVSTGEQGRGKGRWKKGLVCPRDSNIPVTSATSLCLVPIDGQCRAAPDRAKTQGEGGIIPVSPLSWGPEPVPIAALL